MIDERSAESRVPPADRSLAALLRELAGDIAGLIRQEMALARVEIRERLREATKHAGQLAVGVSVAAAGLLVLVAFLVVGLGMLLGGMYWLSTLIVAATFLLGGAGMAIVAARRLGRSTLPSGATLESLRETREWTQNEAADLRAALLGRASDRATALSSGGDAQLQPAPTRGDEKSRASIEPSDDYPPRPAAAKAAPREESNDPLYLRLFHGVDIHDVTGQAAKVAFFMFTSLPPALLVLFSLAGFFGGTELADHLVGRIETALPGSADDPDTAAGFISQFVEEVVTQRAPGLLSVGLLLGIWAGSAIFVSLGASLNTIWGVAEDRPWLKRRAIGIGVMVAFLALFLAGSGLVLAGPQIARALQLGEAGSLAWSILQGPLAFVLIVVAFFLVYYILPNRDQSGSGAVLLRGSVIGAALWLLATLGFRLFISTFERYGETYGFVSAILVLLLWMYLTAIVILFGGEIASEMERTA
ncbi:MAG: YihY family inner membrane protein [Gemmatimonas sp.]|nr:YihY family inner membrane protein [Gemmatimonas sp.]